MLKTNPYVIVIAIDFSKAFDSVGTQLCYRNMRHTSHKTKSTTGLRTTAAPLSFHNLPSANRTEVTASIVQGSTIGLASFVVTASDLHPFSPVNAKIKFADDMYLIVPASNIKSSQLEVDHIEEWAGDNNLVLNWSKSDELVIRTQSQHSVFEPPPAVHQSRVA